MTIRRILEGIRAKNVEATLLFAVFSKVFDSIHREKMEQILLAYDLPIPDIGMMVRVFANGPGDLGSIPGRVILKAKNMVFDASLLNTQHYKVRIKGKVEQSGERSGTLPCIMV